MCVGAAQCRCFNENDTLCAVMPASKIMQMWDLMTPGMSPKIRCFWRMEWQLLKAHHGIGHHTMSCWNILFLQRQIRHVMKSEKYSQIAWSCWFIVVRKKCRCNIDGTGWACLAFAWGDLLASCDDTWPLQVAKTETRPSLHVEQQVSEHVWSLLNAYI